MFLTVLWTSILIYSHMYYVLCIYGMSENKFIILIILILILINPSSNGMVERTNCTFKSMLRSMASDNYMTTWDAKLPLVMMAINNVIHKMTGFAPFRLQVAGNENMWIPADVMFGKANPINYHCWYHK